MVLASWTQPGPFSGSVFTCPLPGMYPRKLMVLMCNFMSLLSNYFFDPLYEIKHEILGFCWCWAVDCSPCTTKTVDLILFTPSIVVGNQVRHDDLHTLHPWPLGMERTLYWTDKTVVISSSIFNMTFSIDASELHLSSQIPTLSTHR